MNRAFVSLVVALTGALIFACSPDPGPFFTPQEFPENQAGFDAGKLGLLTPNLRKDNELIAFRILSGLPVDSPKEEKPASDAVTTSFNSPVFGQQAWLNVRRSIPDPPAPTFIVTYRQSDEGNQYVFYQNCLDDGFETAARTLEDRRRQYSSQATIRAWVVAQDQVFADCNSTQPVYPAVASDASPLVKADRDYQIAAAHFYSEDLVEAEREFRTIAAAAQSPWRQVGSYMVGRTLLREASLKKNAQALPLARAQLANVAADTSAGTLAESARKLSEHLDAIENADAVMQSLSKQLLLPRPDPDAFADAVKQSSFILTAASFNTARSQPGVAEPFDWVQTFESGDAAHAVQKWRATHALPWLTVALMYSGGKDAVAPELIGEADRLPTASPAFGTAKYNAIRLRMEAGQQEKPRKQLDEILVNTDGQPDSLVNAWQAERLRLATGFDDFLHWAPRKPIFGALAISDHPDRPVLAQDSAYVLNYRTPLTKLVRAARSATLPAWSASDVALAAWTRAFILNDQSAARQLAPSVANTHPEWANELTPSDGEQPDHWKFRVGLLIALHHQFQPLIPVDYWHHEDAGDWWCTVSAPQPRMGSVYDGSISWRLPIMFTPSETVISQQEQQEAEDQVERLGKIGSAQSFLAPIIFDWAHSHPDDPLVPQALHQLITVVRYGCERTDAANGQISKTAFNLLHERYPKSEWTAKTPYWFK